MSYSIHMKGYNDIRTLYQIDSIYAWKHQMYFPPVMVEINPTHKCNHKCRYCYTNSRGSNKDILRDDILISSMAQFADAGVKAILFQGTGEPLVHQALPKAIEEGAKHQLTIGLTTNGVLLRNSLQERILDKLFYIRFSVIENDPRRYAYLHGCSENDCRDLINNINNIVSLRHNHNLELGLFASIYLYKDNFHQAHNIVKFFKEIGIDYILVQEATYTEFSPSGKEEFTSAGYSDDEIEEMKQKVFALCDEDFHVKIRFPSVDDSKCIGMTKDSWQNDFCQGTKFYTLLSADGSIYPCWRFWGRNEYSYGSLYENNFAEIWKSERRKKIDTYLNNTPPLGDECIVCNVVKINNILEQYKNASKWKEFLT
ncbi:MAG: radical SAM protein [Deltaproteobacteria bacterium]|nr:MAG: radical SAM protein [Deltaproteobacteria bacterium]